MPHRADRPTVPHSMMMRAPPGAVGAHPPPHAYQMHPADVAAVAAHRARFYAASSGPSASYGHTPPILRHAVTSEHPTAPSGPAVAHARRREPKQRVKKEPPPKKRPTIKEESPEEAAASALLLAANGHSPPSAASKPPPEEPVEEEQEEQEEKPVKKRKKHLDFLRRNSDAATGAATGATANATARQPCHVSPVSSSSIGTHSTAEETVSTSNYATPGSRTSSYDLKEGHPLNPEHRMKDNMDIEVVVGNQHHFPSILHNLLSSSEFAGKVLQWLPHGQAWKVLRWDALRREVLPKHFPQLNEDKSGASTEGSIDSFLSHVRAWGFEEIKDGPDVGAYCHILFLRGVPKLCKQMRCSAPPGPEEESPNTTSPDTKSSTTYESPQQSTDTTNTNTSRQPHSILQVPSLRSDGSEKPQKRWTDRMEEEKVASAAAQEEHRAQQQHMAAAASLKRDAAGYPEPGSPWSGWRQSLDPRVHYRADYGSAAMRHHHHHYPPESPMAAMMAAHHGVVPSPTATPRPWFPFGGSHDQHAQYHSSPRVRSTRGRPAMKQRGETVPMVTEPLEKKSSSSFPVSQRGKGPRGGGGASRRMVVGASSSSEKEQCFGPHLQKEGVAFAVSKKGSTRKESKSEEKEETVADKESWGGSTLKS